MNVAGIGIDAVEICRFKTAIEEWGKNFLKKIFTERELEYAGTKKSYAMHMAGKFAAKEAVKKAIPNGAEIGLNWTQIEILNGEDGKPYVCLHGRASDLIKKYNLSKIYVSISHTDKIAISNAVGVKNGE
ncbi:MAG: holo-ACP synthase [Candidatus Omnitrophota bacterium]